MAIKKFKVMASNAKKKAKSDGSCIPKSMRENVKSGCTKKSVKASSDNRKWVNVELAKDEYEKLRKFLKLNGYQYSPSGVGNMVHVEMYLNPDEIKKVDAYLNDMTDFDEDSIDMRIKGDPTAIADIKDAALSTGATVTDKGNGTIIVHTWIDHVNGLREYANDLGLTCETTNTIETGCTKKSVKAGRTKIRPRDQWVVDVASRYTLFRDDTGDLENSDNKAELIRLARKIDAPAWVEDNSNGDIVFNNMARQDKDSLDIPGYKPKSAWGKKSVKSSKSLTVPKSKRKSVKASKTTAEDTLKSAKKSYNADFSKGPYACAEVNGKGYIYQNFPDIDGESMVAETNVEKTYEFALDQVKKFNRDYLADSVWELQHGVESSKSVKKFGVKASATAKRIAKSRITASERDAIERAKQIITDNYNAEYGESATVEEFFKDEDLNKVGILYTTFGDENEYDFQISVDLNDPKVIVEVDNEVAYEEPYSNMDALIEDLQEFDWNDWYSYYIHKLSEKYDDAIFSSCNSAKSIKCAYDEHEFQYVIFNNEGDSYGAFNSYDECIEKLAEMDDSIFDEGIIIEKNDGHEFIDSWDTETVYMDVQDFNGIDSSIDIKCSYEYSDFDKVGFEFDYNGKHYTTTDFPTNNGKFHAVDDSGVEYAMYISDIIESPISNPLRYKAKSELYIPLGDFEDYDPNRYDIDESKDIKCADSLNMETNNQNTDWILRGYRFDGEDVNTIRIDFQDDVTKAIEDMFSDPDIETIDLYKIATDQDTTGVFDDEEFFATFDREDYERKGKITPAYDMDWADYDYDNEYSDPDAFVEDEFDKAIKGGITVGQDDRYDFSNPIYELDDYVKALADGVINQISDITYDLSKETIAFFDADSNIVFVQPIGGIIPEPEDLETDIDELSAAIRSEMDRSYAEANWESEEDDPDYASRAVQLSEDIGEVDIDELEPITGDGEDIDYGFGFDSNGEALDESTVEELYRIAEYEILPKSELAKIDEYVSIDEDSWDFYMSSPHVTEKFYIHFKLTEKDIKLMDYALPVNSLFPNINSTFVLDFDIYTENGEITSVILEDKKIYRPDGAYSGFDVKRFDEMFNVDAIINYVEALAADTVMDIYNGTTNL